MNMTTAQLTELLDGKCQRNFGCSLQHATKKQLYKTVCTVVRDILATNHASFTESCQKKSAKKVYYMSMEFLTGTSLHNNVYNLGLETALKGALSGLSVSLDQLYDLEPDAGLGNGGLGRLASCYMDSMTTLGIPACGFSICYEFGIFKQKLVNGWQVEFPDNWLEMGDVWLIPRTDRIYTVKFGGRVEHSTENDRYTARLVDYDTVIATPSDMMISGYDTKAVNQLTLWSASSPRTFDMNAFSSGNYMRALEENTMAEVITKVLYPADDHIEGKRLRLKQQYLLVSASLQHILKKHIADYASLSSLPEKVSIHINDTHPALCVPELLRLLIDEYHYDWDAAWDICQRTLAYTNHTVMSEALERWPEHLFVELFPRIHELVCEINRRLMERLQTFFPDDYDRLNYMAVVCNSEVRMANLCLSCVYKINGVSQLHSDILTTSIFKDYYKVQPEKFTNVTNGIAYRRWLCQSNPGLTALLQQLIGDEFLQDSTALEKLLDYRDDAQVLTRLQEIKHENKLRLCNYIEHQNGVRVDPASIFDIQIKRLHEYKRQLLNVLQILHLYHQIKLNPDIDMPPRTFIFAAKASAGYMMAKQTIRLIDTVSKLVNHDPMVRDKLKVVFIEDYKVSLAEIIIPAADISEQISIAGKEASGTGNMKLMINGAVTIGTMDGANVEIFQQVGAENMFLFGMNAEEVEDLWRKGYHPHDFYNRNHDLRAVVDMLVSGALGETFHEIYDSLLTYNYGTADAYMTLADFDSYVKAQERVATTYTDRTAFTKMSLTNIAKAGLFSSDRAILEYANNIWHVKPIR